MFTILHISDIHRSGEDSLSNGELVSSLIADIERWQRESKNPAPEFLIISGDLIQGLGLNSPAYPEGLRQQYSEAESLLDELVARLLNNDRSRVAMVPGNHDVDWNAAASAMTPIENVPGEVPLLLANPMNGYRWSWKDRRLYKIADLARYRARLNEYKSLLSRFYEGIPTVDVDPTRAWVSFSFPTRNIMIYGFDSCHYNDCYCPHGAIDLDAICAAHLDLRERRGATRLCVALWHHSINGIPGRSDFMDPDTVKLLIDKGFHVGFHGHQHHADASPVSLVTSDKRSMAVISAGSLGATGRELPTGHKQQYNLVVVSDSFSTAIVYVREMYLRGVFGPGRLLSLGGLSNVTVEWTPSPPLPPPTGQCDITAVLDEVDMLKAAGRYSEAADQLKSLPRDLPGVRALLLDTLFGAARWSDIVRELGDPQNVHEVVLGFRAAEELHDWDGCTTFIRKARELAVDGGVMRDLESRLKVHRSLE